MSELNPKNLNLGIQQMFGLLLSVISHFKSKEIAVIMKDSWHVKLSKNSISNLEKYLPLELLELIKQYGDNWLLSEEDCIARSYVFNLPKEDSSVDFVRNYGLVPKKNKT